MFQRRPALLRETEQSLREGFGFGPLLQVPLHHRIGQGHVHTGIQQIGMGVPPQMYADADDEVVLHTSVHQRPGHPGPTRCSSRERTACRHVSGRSVRAAPRRTFADPDPQGAHR